MMTLQESQGNSMLGVGHVVTTSVGMCDIDIRPVSNFILEIDLIDNVRLSLSGLLSPDDCSMLFCVWNSS